MPPFRIIELVGGPLDGEKRYILYSVTYFSQFIDKKLHGYTIRESGTLRRNGIVLFDYIGVKDACANS